MPMEMIGHKKKQYLYYGKSRKRRETESIFKAIIVENFPKLGERNGHPDP